MAGVRPGWPFGATAWQGDLQIAIENRQNRGFTDQIRVAFVVRIYRHGGVTQHRFRACCGNHNEAITVFNRIFDVPQLPLVILMNRFFVGKRRVAAGAPVNNVFTAVN